MAVEQIDGYRAAELIEQGAVVLDLRQPADFAGGHIEGAVNVPFDGRFADAVVAAVPHADQPVIVCCYAGVMSSMAAKLLDQGGYTNVYDFGSIQEWPYELVAE